ncbi:hypothetical protein HDU82_006603, partial [Entophlyctis luteolus]
KSSSLASLVARFRKETDVSIARARSLLSAHGNDYEQALAAFRVEAPAGISAKTAARTTREGLIGVWCSNSGRNAGIVEVNCETDFVARSAVFAQLVAAARDAVAVTPATSKNLLEDLQEDALKVIFSVEDDARIAATVAKVGENIRVRRAVRGGSVETVLFGAYAHGGADATTGKIGAVAALRFEPMGAVGEKARVLARQIAQQVVGLSPVFVSLNEVPGENRMRMSSDDLEAQVLLEQPFLMGGGKVKDVLEAFRCEHALESVSVVEFKRLVVGEGVEAKKSSFADEVMEQLKK